MPWHGAVIKPAGLYLSDQRVLAYQRAILGPHHLGQRRFSAGTIAHTQMVPHHPAVSMAPRRAPCTVDATRSDHHRHSEHCASTLLMTIHDRDWLVTGSVPSTDN